MQAGAYLSPARRPVPAGLAVMTTVLAATVMFVLPAADHANLWAVLVALFPASVASAFALAWASTAGAFAGLIAAAIGDRDPVRPALTLTIVLAIVSPAAFGVPVWPALLAAAGLIAVPARARLIAANDNPAAEPANPFALAA